MFVLNRLSESSGFVGFSPVLNSNLCVTAATDGVRSSGSSASSSLGLNMLSRLSLGLVEVPKRPCLGWNRLELAPLSANRS